MDFKKELPNYVTIFNGFLASLSILLVANRYTDMAVRVIFLSMALDVLDGYLARKLDAMSEKGELLDRVFDRLYQIIAPSILYCIMNEWSIGSMFYSSLIITISFWRLTKKVPSKEYFSGLPLFVHTFLILLSYLSGLLIPYFIMLVFAFLSSLPLKYFRRVVTYGQNETTGTFWQLRIIIPLILAIIPYSGLNEIFEIFLFLIIIYSIAGWIPLYNQKFRLSRRG